MILKPAEQTPLTALLLAEVIAEAGVPDGVFNVLTGFGDVGAALSRHDDVDKVAFTGSTEVGKKIVDAASGNLKKVSLELGGKSPQVIFADADLEAAIPGVASGFLFNHGQACTAGTRLLVEDRDLRRIHVGCRRFRAQSQKIGPGLDPTNDIGPLISQEQLAKVTGYLDAGIADGARALTGGKRHGDSGFYVEPTLLVDVRPRLQRLPGGDLRPRRGGGAVQPRRRRPRRGQRHPLRPRRQRLDPGRLPRPRGRRGDQGGHGVGQLPQCVRRGACRSAATSSPGWGRELGEGAIAEYTQTKSVNIAL